jgi:UDP-perosamine 4-acetyltransferase
MTTSNERPLIIVGTGGHARVLAAGLLSINRTILGFTDYSPKFKQYLGIPTLGDDEIIMGYNSKKIELINGIGSIPFNNIRSEVFTKFKRLGYQFATFIHPTSYIEINSSLSEGCQILAGSYIQTGSKINENVIINTGAIIEHDCEISAHCHIAPNATLCGGVKLAQRVHVGTSATIIQEIDIGADTIIGAGCTITKNIDKYSIVKPAESSIEKRRG